jgi:hypothetical protein
MLGKTRLLGQQKSLTIRIKNVEAGKHCQCNDITMSFLGPVFAKQSLPVAYRFRASQDKIAGSAKIADHSDNKRRGRRTLPMQ